MRPRRCRVNGVQVGVIGPHRQTPDTGAVRADSTAGLLFSTRPSASIGIGEMRADGVDLHVVVIHAGACSAPTDRRSPRRAMAGSDHQIVDQCRTRPSPRYRRQRPAHETRRRCLPVAEASRGASYPSPSYSGVATSSGRRGDARGEEHRGAPDPDVQAIVDAAQRGATAVSRTRSVGTQSLDVLLTRPASRNRRGNMFRTRARKYPRDRAHSQLGRLRRISSRLLTGEQPGEITWGEVFAVLPFGNRRSSRRSRRAPTAALLTGLSPNATRDRHGRFPQVAGLHIDYAARARAGDRWPVRAPAGGRYADVRATHRLVTTDFMFRRWRGHGCRRHGRPATR